MQYISIHQSGEHLFTQNGITVSLVLE